MVPSKYIGRITILSIVALTMAISSLMMPWYRVDYSRDVPDYYPYTRSYVFYTHGWSENGGVTTARYDFRWTADLKETMGSPVVFVAAWFIVLLLFLVFVFSGSPGIVPGSILLAAGYIAVLYFVVKLPEAISTAADSHILPRLYDLSFTGSYELESTGETWTWGPAFGWFMMVGASIVQTLAIVARILTVIRPQAKSEEAKDEIKLDLA